MKRKKKLPKFALGTRMPRSLGYQPNYGIGNTQFTSTPGESLVPETKTVRQNIIPNALNKLTSTSQFALDFLKSSAPAAGSATSTVARAAAHRAGGQAVQFAPDVLTASTPGSNASVGGTATNVGGQAASKGINALGGVLGGIGTAYGLADMGMQLAHNKDHRTAGDMRNYMTTNTYTTDLGNQYKLTTGLDRGAELDYADAQKLSKNVNFTTSAIGTGLSLGTMLTALGAGGSVLGPIGAGVGLLGGLAAYALGFGDTKEDVKQAIEDAEDSTAREGRMSESLAKDADTKQGFYGGTKSGSIHAANGKRPSYRNGKGNAMVSHGETNVHSDGTYEVYPGTPDKDDSLKRYVKKSDTIFSNNNVATGISASDYFQRTHDYSGALVIDEVNRNYIKNNNTTGMIHAKCGKLPKYANGVSDYIMSAIPNIGQWLYATQQHNIDKNMPVNRPEIRADYSSARNQAYAAMNDLMSARPYLDLLDKETKKNIWDIRRMPVLGAGGRAAMIDSANNKAIEAKINTLLDIEDRNKNTVNSARQLLANINQHEVDTNNANAWKAEQLYQQAAGAKYNALAQDLKNKAMVLTNQFKDFWNIKQFHDTKDIQNKQLGLIDRQVSLEEQKYLNSLKDAVQNNKQETNGVILPSSFTIPTNQFKLQYPQYNLTQPSSWRYPLSGRTYGIPNYTLNLTTPMPTYNIPQSDMFNGRGLKLIYRV